MSQRYCEFCGGPLVSKRADARFCRSSCRAKAHQARKDGTVKPFPTPTPAPQPEQQPLGVVPDPEPTLLDRTRAQLEAAGRAETPLGELAMVLAARLSSGREYGSAVSSLSKEYRAVLEEALKGAHAADDPVNDAREKARRLRRVG